MVSADAIQHRCQWWRSTYLVRSPVAAVVDRIGPLSPIAGRGRYQLETGLLAFGGLVAQPRNRYKPDRKARRREFAHVLR
jgi:hypothetical protein